MLSECFVKVLYVEISIGFKSAKIACFGSIAKKRFAAPQKGSIYRLKFGSDLTRVGVSQDFPPAQRSIPRFISECAY